MCGFTFPVVVALSAVGIGLLMRLHIRAVVRGVTGVRVAVGLSVGRSEAADAGSGLQSQALTSLRHCAFWMLFLRRVRSYNLVALETGQPKSPSGANEQY